MLIVKFTFVLAVLPILCYTFQFDGDDFESLYDQKRKIILRNVPNVMKRFYIKHATDVNCIDRALHSTPAHSEVKRNHWYSSKILLPARNSSVTEAYFLLEFSKVSDSNEILKRNCSIEIRFPNRMHAQYLNPSEVVINKNKAEIFFNITQHYNEIKQRGKNNFRFRFRFVEVSFRKNLRMFKMKKHTFNFKSIKSFLITHEENKDCYSFAKSASWISDKLMRLTKMKSMTRSRKALQQYPVEKNPTQPCKLKDWYVSFHDVGWNSFVVAPKGINARACSGSCTFPSVNATEHALLQSSVSLMMGKESSVCCVPVSSDPVTLLLYDEISDDVYVFMYPNLIANGCGCL